MIVGCTSPMSHQEVEQVHCEKDQGRFQLKEHLQCAHVSHPNDAIAKEANDMELINTDDEEDFEVNDTQEQVSDGRKQLQAQFGHKHTHNEQIIVAPCGMIIARETFYGAEGVGSVTIQILKPCNGYF